MTQAITRGSTPTNPHHQLPQPDETIVRNPDWVAATLRDALREANLAASSQQNMDLIKAVCLDAAISRLIETMDTYGESTDELLTELQARNFPGVTWDRYSGLHAYATSPEGLDRAVRELRLTRSIRHDFWHGRIDGHMVFVRLVSW